MEKSVIEKGKKKKIFDAAWWDEEERRKPAELQVTKTADMLVFLQVYPFFSSSWKIYLDLEGCYSVRIRYFWTVLDLVEASGAPRILLILQRAQVLSTTQETDRAQQCHFYHAWLVWLLCALHDGCDTSRKPQLEAGCSIQQLHSTWASLDRS